MKSAFRDPFADCGDHLVETNKKRVRGSSGDDADEASQGVVELNAGVDPDDDERELFHSCIEHNLRVEEGRREHLEREPDGEPDPMVFRDER